MKGIAHPPDGSGAPSMTSEGRPDDEAWLVRYARQTRATVMYNIKARGRMHWNASGAGGHLCWRIRLRGLDCLCVCVHTDATLKLEGKHTPTGREMDPG